MSLGPVNTDSLGEQIQRAFPAAEVVKTLHTVNHVVMVDPARVPGEHHVFVTGDDEDARAAASALLLGFGRPQASVIDLGGIPAARATGMLLPFRVRMMGTLGHPGFNFHIQRAR